MNAKISLLQAWSTIVSDGVTIIAVLSILTAIPANAESICDVYSTRCQPYNAPQRVGPLGLEGYPGTSPIYTPRQLVPSMGFVIRGALEAIPPHMRRQLYPDSVRDAVRSGNVDRAIEGAMRRSVDPYLNAINGYGPGGAESLMEPWILRRLHAKLWVGIDKGAQKPESRF